MFRSHTLGLLLVLASCGHKSSPPVRKDAGVAVTPADAAAPIAIDALVEVTLPPAPPLPDAPLGLPAAPELNLTPEAVAFGALLFADPRLSATGAASCATCHRPEAGYSGVADTPAADGKPNLRRVPPLANLAWTHDYGWDGRANDLTALLAAHAKGQLGSDGEALVANLAGDATMRAHFKRVGGSADPTAAVAIRALAAFVQTRYAGDSAWDRGERGRSAPPEVRAGFEIFNGKAQCAGCHAAPLYTDGKYHAIGLVAVADEGRGRVDPQQRGAFRTPGLRGVASRPALFHDGSATTLEAAVDFHLAGGLGQGADASIVDPALKPVTLTADERAQLLAFLRAL